MLYDTKNPHGGDIYAGNVRLDFSANTNPFGTPESVLAAITRALPEVHRYPDPYCRALRAAIAAAEGVPEEYILCGSGAAELIYAFADAVRPQRAAELAMQGVAAEIQAGGKAGWRVRVGPFEDRKSAREVASSLADQGFSPSVASERK